MNLAKDLAELLTIEGREKGRTARRKKKAAVVERASVSAVKRASVSETRRAAPAQPPRHPASSQPDVSSLPVGASLSSLPLAPASAPLPRKGFGPRTISGAKIVPSDTYSPRVGDRFSIEPPSPQVYPFDAEVVEVEGDSAKVVIVPPGEKAEAGMNRVSMPAASVAHFANDLRGLVYGGPGSGDPSVDAVLKGRGSFLGKGDDGIAFRVEGGGGPFVVKVSTTVPFQPANQGHTTPKESVRRLREQHERSEAMRSAGIGSLLPARFVEHGRGNAVKGFLIKPYVEIPEKLSLAQLEEIAASVEAAHKAGWVFRDDLQVGTRDGKAYHYDTGKAAYVGKEKASPDDWRSDASLDVQRLKSLYRANGQKYLTVRERNNPIAEFEELSLANPDGMTEEQKKKNLQRMFMLSFAIKKFLKENPDGDHGFWSDPEYADEEIRLAMKRLKTAT